MQEAIDRVRNDLTARALPSCQPAQLLTSLASAMLLLRVAARQPLRALDEQVQCLYSETISLAQRRGLFTAFSGQSINMELIRRNDDNEMTWKAWARIESTKRLIIGLIMCDAYYCSMLDCPPTIRIDGLGFAIPCSNELFESPNHRKWAQLASTSTQSLIAPVTVLDSNLTVLNMPPLSTEIAMAGLLAALWLRSAEARCRLLNPHRFQHLTTPHDISNSDVPIPLIRVSAELGPAQIAPVLNIIPLTYQPVLRTCNPNVHAFWHAQCLSLLADIPLFELAAGREGPERAKMALELISVWAHTAAARRACVHAAQTFSVMSARRINDGTTYHSEIALFHGALVLGLYLFTVHDEQDGDAIRCDDEEVFELLEPVDWSTVGEQGMSVESVNSVVNPALTMTTAAAAMPYESAARRFITRGGTVSFNGAMHRGGYNSARRILLDYANLMKSVAKWNVRGYCRILRIMSDTLIEVDETPAQSP